jgi:hypothetical protein
MYVDVVAQIRATLPEFAQRNGVDLTPKVMDNLAHWVAGAVPSGTFRAYCVGIGGDGEEDIACACPGVCRCWMQLTPDETRDLPER